MSLSSGQMSLIDRLFGPQEAKTNTPAPAPKTNYISTVLNDARDRNNINQIRRGNASAIPAHVFEVTTKATVGVNNVQVVTTFRRNADPNYVKTNIYATGYKGSQNPVLVASGDSPISFTLDNTGENVVLRAVASGNSGEANFTTAPSSGIALRKSSLGGYGLTSAASAQNLDQVPDGTQYIRGTQYSGAQIVLDNPNALAGTAGWSTNPGLATSTLFAGASLATDSASPVTNGKSFKITTTIQQSGATPSQVYKASPGDVFTFSAQVLSDGVFGINGYIFALDGAGNRLSFAGLGGTFSQSWLSESVTYTAPANSVAVTIVFRRDDASGGSHSAWFTNVHLVRRASLDTEVNDGSTRFAQTAGGLTYRPTTNPLSATDAGSTDTVSIAAFTMRCTGHSDVSVSSGSITALSRSTLYYIYYDDATLAGGAVAFNATTTKETAINGAGRFFVGSITTPIAAGAATVGNNDGGVGAQGGGTSIFLFGAVAQSVSNAAVTITNPNKCFDGGTSTFAAINANTTNLATDGNLIVSGMSPSSAPWQSLTLNVRTAVPACNASCTMTVSYSLDGGSTFTTIYTGVTTRAATVDSVSLPTTQNLALLRVKVDLNRTAVTTTDEIDFYEAWVLGVE